MAIDAESGVIESSTTRDDERSVETTDESVDDVVRRVARSSEPK
jgi:hypothetical protein